MVVVQLPETTVEHIKVFVREVVSNLIYVVFSSYLFEYLNKVGPLEVPESDFRVVIRVN